MAGRGGRGNLAVQHPTGDCKKKLSKCYDCQWQSKFKYIIQSLPHNEINANRYSLMCTMTDKRHIIDTCKFLSISGIHRVPNKKIANLRYLHATSVKHIDVSNLPRVVYMDIRIDKVILPRFSHLEDLTAKYAQLPQVALYLVYASFMYMSANFKQINRTLYNLRDFSCMGVIAKLPNNTRPKCSDSFDIGTYTHKKLALDRYYHTLRWTNYAIN